MTTTPCYLTVLKKLTPEQIAELAPLVEAANPDDPDVAEALSENAVIRFEAIFEGDMPMEMMRWFSTHKIPYLWQWDQFYGTGAGAQFYQANIDHLHHLRIHEELCVIPITQATDKDVVSQTIDATVELNRLLIGLGLNKKPF
ncbi:hypothetical protein PXK56_18355 [Phaeobacter gallaeciensis]|uniref:hypothetical protein n=1 Tax=Phaeobacter gallaeciensis TaxID=60890 RepID=UPI002380C37F|nr:hypothetical protein [Phaeobacter gallaeciensis]MDE4297150.1 hypothetical protein [Phaeobacter gallaeciensis]